MPDTKTRVTIADLRAHIKEVLLGAAVAASVFVSLASVSIALDVHQIRIANLQAEAELRSALTTRLDSLLWKADTFLTIQSAMGKSLSAGFTQVRVQVEQSAQDQKQAIKSAETYTAKAVEKTITTAAAAIQEAAATQPVPVVHVEPAKPATVTAPTVTVNPLLAQPAKPAKPTPERKSHWRWLRRLWPFHVR